jgi:hypothetical protein
MVSSVASASSVEAAGSSAGWVGLSPSAKTKELVSKAVNTAVHIAQLAIAGVFFMIFLLEMLLALNYTKLPSSSVARQSIT